MTNEIELGLSKTKTVTLKKKALQIEINAVDDLFNLDGLSPVSHLEKVIIKNCDNLIDISVLKDFKNLRYLEIENCPNIKDLSPINGLEKLRKLKCIGFPNLDVLATLCDNNKVKKLDILQDRKSFTGFLDDDEIELFIYFQANHVADLNPIVALKQFKKLGFHYCSQLRNVSGIEVLHSIQEVSFYSCNELNSIRSISPLTNLKSFSIEQCNSIFSIDEVLANSNMQKLSISDCQNLNEITIPEINQLIELKLHSNIKLQHLKNLINLQKLKVLLIEDCNTLTDLEAIGSLKYLEELGLFYNNVSIAEETLAQLSKLKSLRIWTATNKLNIPFK